MCHGGRSQYDVPCDKQWQLDITAEDDDDSSYHADDDIDGATMDVELESDGKQEATYEPGLALVDENLLSFLRTNFCCCVCASKGNNSSLDLNHKTIGLETTIYYSCNQCGDSSQLEPTKATAPIRARSGSPNRPLRSEDSDFSMGLQYAINQQFVPAMQFSGLSFSDAMSISGLLGLDGSLYWDMWKAIEDHVGIIQHECALLATERCYAEELNQSSVDSDGSKILVCSFDMGWHKWSTGHIYNSLSGQAFLIGANTRKVIRMLVKAKKMRHM